MSFCSWKSGGWSSVLKQRENPDLWSAGSRCLASSVNTMLIVFVFIFLPAYKLIVVVDVLNYQPFTATKATRNSRFETVEGSLPTEKSRKFPVLKWMGFLVVYVLMQLICVCIPFTRTVKIVKCFCMQLLWVRSNIYWTFVKTNTDNLMPKIWFGFYIATMHKLKWMAYRYATQFLDYKKSINQCS